MGIILILKVSVVLVIVSPAINYEDEFLRSYKPNPFLPRKLNEFYASIQNHKDEFRQIRELAKRNINRNELKRNNILPNEFSYINQFNTMENNNDFNLESRPSNDIYPYMYRKSNPEHNLRFRRNLRVHINNEAKYGDISSNSRKYPDRFQQKRGEDQDTDDLQVEKYNYEIINSPPIVEPRRPVLIDKEDESIIDQFVKDRKKPLLIKIMHKGNQGKFQTPRHVNYNSLSNNHVNELEDNSWDNYASEHENQKVDQNGSSKILKDLLDTNAKEVNLQPIKFIEGNPKNSPAISNVRSQYVNEDSLKDENNEPMRDNQKITRDFNDEVPLNQHALPESNNVDNTYAGSNMRNVNHQYSEKNINIQSEEDGGKNFNVESDNQQYKRPLTNTFNHNKVYQKETRLKPQEKVFNNAQLNPESESQNVQYKQEGDIKEKNLAVGNYPDMSDYWTNSEKQQIQKGIEKAQVQDTEDKAKAIVMAMNIKEVNEQPTEVKEKGFENVDSITIESETKPNSCYGVEKRLDEQKLRNNSREVIGNVEFDVCCGGECKKSNNNNINNNNNNNEIKEEFESNLQKLYTQEKNKIKQKLPSKFSSIILEPKSRGYPNYQFRQYQIPIDSPRVNDVQPNHRQQYPNNYEINNANKNVPSQDIQTSADEQNNMGTNENNSEEASPPNDNNIDPYSNNTNVKHIILIDTGDSDVNQSQYNTLYEPSTEDPNLEENERLQKELIEESIEEVLPYYKPTRYKGNKSYNKRMVQIPPRIYRTHGIHVKEPNHPNTDVDLLLEDLRLAAKEIKKHSQNKVNTKLFEKKDANNSSNSSNNFDNMQSTKNLDVLQNHNMNDTEDKDAKLNRISKTLKSLLSEENSKLEEKKMYLKRQLKSIQENKEEDDFELSINPFTSHMPNVDESKSNPKKIRAEGDYGEEEDSTKTKTHNEKLVKKTKNKFANPSNPTDDAAEYLDDEINPSQLITGGNYLNNKHLNQNIYESESDTHNNDEAFVHHQHKAYNEKFKRSTSKPKYPRPIITTENPENPSVTDGWKPFQRDMDNESEDDDFKRWPKYVIEDLNKREQVRKRSLSKQKKIELPLIPNSESSFYLRKPREFTTSTVQTTSSVSSSATNTTIVNNSSDVMDNSVTIIPINVDEVEEENSSEPESLSDLINGEMGINIINTVNENIENSVSLKKKYRIEPRPPQMSQINMGLCSNENITTNVSKPQQPQEIILAKKLVESVSKILHTYLANFKIDGVKMEATCKPLTSTLKDFLNNMLTVPKTEFLDNLKEEEEMSEPTQSAYLFKPDNDPRLEEKEQKEMAQKVNVLQQLLNKYEKLPEKCKIRAKPVKEYIQKHLQLLNKVYDSNSVPDISSGDFDQTLPETNNVDNLISKVDPGNEVVEQQLESMGLGHKNDNFHANLDLNIMPGHCTDNPQLEKRETQTDKRIPTKRFLKLFSAVRHSRQRRESEDRLGEMYVRETAPMDSYVDNDSSKYQNPNFETPLVYSL